MAQEKRSSYSSREGASLENGPYLARIVGHLDPSLMGSLEVTLLREQGNTIGDDNQSYVVRCAMPFFGYTAFEFMGQNDGSKKTIDGYNDTQKSYGMWFVPPDIGVNVLVFFVNGDPSQGYWMGCVPGKFTNNMVPGIAGSTEVSLDDDDKKKYNTKQPLPVAEINKKLNVKDQKIDPDKIKKVVHPIADRFLEQGLLEDDTRGVVTSSARREAPSAVYGISTPGPLDKRAGAKRALIGKQEDLTTSTVPVSRLGGTQFVMDDGDERYVRATPASEGPVKYIDLANGVDAVTGDKTNEKGDATIPYGECLRLRTRTGHQILLHNSEDLIYIGNSRGTTWVELTSNGKIDIYAKDSISIHTETDLNLFANRDINFEAGRNFNLKTGGRFKADVGSDFEIAVGANGKLTVASNWDQRIGGTAKISSAGDMNLVTSADAKYTSSGNTNIAAVGEIIQSGAEIHMNGKLAEIAEVAEQVVPLTTHENIVTSLDAGWEKKYISGKINSIMKRIPMHEPWPLHEHQAPAQLTPSNTDRDA
jgi:hypothetical protein